MVTWERLSSNMEFLIIFVVFLVAIPVISLILQYLIKTNKIKPNKVSRIFHEDDESFIISWKKIKEKGILRYTLKSIITSTTTMVIMMGILLLIGINEYKQIQMLFDAFLLGVIFGLLSSLLGWVINSDRYSKLKEKVENGN